MNEPPAQGPFCQICHGPWPDGHRDWCPIKTGEPQIGAPSLQQQMQAGQGLQGLQSGLLGQSPVQPYERLSYIIEHLCDHLRELRREKPAHFYDTPYENLLRTLDSGLESYYRDKK
jgi:hypothetical protein